MSVASRSFALPSISSTRLTLTAIASVVTLALVGALLVLSSGSTMTLSLDGQAREIRSGGETVAEVLEYRPDGVVARLSDGSERAAARALVAVGRAPNTADVGLEELGIRTERGLIAADNTLWSGRVLDESDESDGTTAIRAFNEHVRADDRVVSVMLTVRDGVTLIRRA